MIQNSLKNAQMYFEVIIRHILIGEDGQEEVQKVKTFDSKRSPHNLTSYQGKLDFRL